MANAIDVLEYSWMSRAYNRIKPPAKFLRDLLFSQRIAVPTTTIALEHRKRGRTVAPLVKSHLSEAAMIEGDVFARSQVSPPTIRIKRPIDADILVTKRRPGDAIFPTKQSLDEQIRQEMVRAGEILVDARINREEVMCSQALKMVISYSRAGYASYQVTFPRDAGQNLSASVFWDDADPDLPAPLADLLAVKRLVSDSEDMPIRVGICGREAASALMNLAEKRSTLLDKRRLRDGEITAEEQFLGDTGAIYIGRLGDVRFWEYGRQVTLDDGTTYDMIRPKYIEFVATGREARRILYYGAIKDIKALRGRVYVDQSFSKSWETEDPSALMFLHHSCPLPTMELPNTSVSMKVVSG